MKLIINTIGAAVTMTLLGTGAMAQDVFSPPATVADATVILGALLSDGTVLDPEGTSYYTGMPDDCSEWGEGDEVGCSSGDVSVWTSPEEQQGGAVLVKSTGITLPAEPMVLETLANGDSVIMGWNGDALVLPAGFGLCASISAAVPLRDDTGNYSGGWVAAPAIEQHRCWTGGADNSAEALELQLFEG